MSLYAEMVESEEVCLWRVWDERLTCHKLQCMLIALRSQQKKHCEEHPVEKLAVGEAKKLALNILQDCTHIELVNADLAPKVLSEIVNEMVDNLVVQRLLIMRLDDNALGEEAALPLCKLLLHALNLREMSLRNIGMTDGLWSRIIGCCAQMEKRAQPLVVDIRDNGLLTGLAKLSLIAGMRLFPKALTIVSDLLPFARNV